MNQTLEEIKLNLNELLVEKLKEYPLQEGGQQRTVGDIMEKVLYDTLMEFQNTQNNQVKKARGKKSIEDLTIVTNENTIYVDLKTKNIDAKMSMPNLVSVEKLKKLKSQKNYEILYVFISYKIENNTVKIEKIESYYIWEISFSVLQVGNLGLGQLQIKNAKNPIETTINGKEWWYSELKKLVINYIEDLQIKLEKRKKNWEKF